MSQDLVRQISRFARNDKYVTEFMNQSTKPSILTMNPEELKQLENDLWRSADTLRANSDLKSSEYSTPVLGLIFLKFADNRYRLFEKEILREYTRLEGIRYQCSDASLLPRLHHYEKLKQH